MPDVRRLKVKVCLVGPGAVGKTALVRRFIRDQFDGLYVATVGAKVSRKEVTVPEGEGTAIVDMTIWDVMGEKGFRDLLKEAYFHGAHGILAVCDVTRRDTLGDLQDWIAAVHNAAGPVPMHLLANKVDLTDQCVLAEEDVRRVAEAHRCGHAFTSAKTGENVEAAFQALAAEIAARTRKAEPPPAA